MEIKAGRASEFGRRKLDVAVGEADLARLLTEAGIPPESELTTTEVFRVLYAEAERLALAAWAAVDPASASAQASHTRNLAVVLSEVRLRLGIAEPVSDAAA